MAWRHAEGRKTTENSGPKFTVIDLTASTAEELLDMLASGMAAMGTNNVTHGGETALALSPEHAELLHRDGFTRAITRRVERFDPRSERALR